MSGQLSLAVAARGSAVFSPCPACNLLVSPLTGRCATCGAQALYRYSLTRPLGGTKTLAVMGVNPSTATAEEDDATIRRDIGFARSLGFGRLLKLNLFGRRDKDVRSLLSAGDPVGPDNDNLISLELASFDLFIAAWGAKRGRLGKLVDARAAQVLELVTRRMDVHALRITPDGHPEHSLFLPADLRPILFRQRRSNVPTPSHLR